MCTVTKRLSCSLNRQIINERKLPPPKKKKIIENQIYKSLKKKHPVKAPKVKIA